MPKKFVLGSFHIPFCYPTYYRGLNSYQYFFFFLGGGSLLEV